MMATDPIPPTALLEAVSAAAVRLAAARTEFEDAIRSAHPAHPVRTIADASGLAKSRVHQIIQEGATQ